MPTYVYACDSCGNQFERFQSFKDEPLQTCPACAGAVRRVFQPVGIVFKGSGWYVTDNKAKSATASVPAVAKAEAKAEGKGESKSESKDSSASPATSTVSDPGTSSKSDTVGSKGSSSE